jgi:ubiquinone/menaquinone biosynthesis methyltransferase
MDDRLPRGALKRALDTPEAKHRYVRQLFGTIADRYDLITRFLSFGQDQRWKRRLIALAGPTSNTRVLDLACGTGDLALLAAANGASTVGLDFVHRMVEIARVRAVGTSVRWIVGDMGSLPVAAGTFDVITTGYGLRNVPNLVGAIAEAHRVLSSGGRLASLDFDRPEFGPLRAVYLAYLTVVGSTLGVVLHGNPDTYRYIPASIRRYPGARRVAEHMRNAGFVDVRHIPVLGGLMAIHLARKP